MVSKRLRPITDAAESVFRPRASAHRAVFGRGASRLGGSGKDLHAAPIRHICYRFTSSEQEAQDLEQLSTIEEIRAVWTGGMLAGRETRETLLSTIEKLSPALRETVILRDLEEMEYKEIAKVLNVPEGTVKSRLNRGRAELARILRKNKIAV